MIRPQQGVCHRRNLDPLRRTPRGGLMVGDAVRRPLLRPRCSGARATAIDPGEHRWSACSLHRDFLPCLKGKNSSDYGYRAC